MATVEGFVDPGFAPVRAAFEENFIHRGELGAAVCVIVGGKTVVDLWGGIADRATGRRWQRDTLAFLFSATKGATALTAHLLAARGRLDLDAPVARYWPEFAAAGKDRIPVRMLLNHQAGLAAIERRMPQGALFDWKAMVDALAEQRPLWPPGSAHGYHALTFGWLVGEVVCRVSGRSIGHFFRDEVAGPLGLDFWIGLPEEHEPRVAAVRMPPLRQACPEPSRRAQGERVSGDASAAQRAMRVPATLTAKAFGNPPGTLRASELNSRAMHAAEIPAANGIATARALAGMYAPLACGGRLRSVDLVDRETLRAMSTVESEGEDLVLLLPTRFSAGFMRSVDNRNNEGSKRDSCRMGPNEAAFGHAGAGGSIGFADPDTGVAFAYVMNQLGHGVMLNERGQTLIDCVYECL